jgi:ribonuclease Z
LIGAKRLDGAHDFSRGMYAVITGSGSALIDPERGGASAAVIVDGTALQFDCGRLVMENLTRAGINPVDVDALFFTHLHFDHVASFGYFVISSWIAGRQKSLDVYGPSGTRRMAEGMIFGGHHTDVEFARGLVAEWPPDVPGRPPAEPPFAVTEIGPGLVLETPDLTVRAVPVPHFQHLGVQSLGYRVDSKHGSVVVTGDCRPCPEMTELAGGADLLIHECAKPDGDMLTSGKLTRNKPTEKPSGGHTTPTWLGKVARETGVKTVVATHLAPLTALPAARAMSEVYYGSDPPRADIWLEYERRIRANFDGEVLLAEDGLVLRVGR